MFSRKIPERATYLEKNLIFIIPSSTSNSIIIYGKNVHTKVININRNELWHNFFLLEAIVAVFSFTLYSDIRIDMPEHWERDIKKRFDYSYTTKLYQQRDRGIVIFLDVLEYLIHETEKEEWAYRICALCVGTLEHTFFEMMLPSQLTILSSEVEED